MRPTHFYIRGLTIAIAILLSACESINEPDLTRVDQTEIRLTSLTDSARITAFVGSTEAKYLALNLASEQRYLATESVLDTIALKSGRIRAHSPGVAIVSVKPTTPAGAAAVSVTVRVQLTRPAVLSIQSQPADDEADVLLVRGYRLNEIALSELRLNGVPVSAELRDSSTLLMRLDALERGPACTAAAASVLAAPGLDIRQDVRIRRRQKGEVDLAVGALRKMTSAEVRCLRLRAHPGAAYALAYVDPAQIRSAVDAPETTQAGYTLRVEHLDPMTTLESARASQAARIPTSVPHGPHTIRSSVTRSDDSLCTAFWEELRPFECMPAVSLGDQIERPATAWRARESYHAVRVDGHIVFLVNDTDSASYNPQTAKALDDAMQPVLEHGVPLIRQIFHEADPFSSHRSSQLFVFLYKHDPKKHSHYAYVLHKGSVKYDANGDATYASTYAYVHIPIQHLSSREAPSTLAHELTHAWEERSTVESRPALVGLPSHDTWQAEGVATLVAQEVMRRWAGVSVDANYDLRKESGASIPGQLYGFLAAGGTGEFTGGYNTPASFMWDLARRRADAGESWDVAFREVARAMLEGWHGHLRGSTRGETVPGLNPVVYKPYRTMGLTNRMRSKLGPSWDPAEAMMQWTLSNALDDLTTSPTYQNRSFLDAGTQGWKAHARFRTGSGIVESSVFYNDSPATQQQIALRRDAGGTGFFFIEDDGKGGTYAVEASRPDLLWTIARFR